VGLDVDQGGLEVDRVEGHGLSPPRARRGAPARSPPAGRRALRRPPRG
jgi:hypothetical protein